MKILVLCIGNIGRSPVAEVLLKHELARGLGIAMDQLESVGVVVTSAGTEAPDGHPASVRGVRMAAGLGLDISGHEATQLTPAALREADQVYVMDSDQLAAVKRVEPTAVGKTDLLSGEGIEIPDPHHQSDKFFAMVFSQVERAVKDRVPEMLERIRSATELRTQAE